MEKKKPLGEETKDQALAIFIEKHTRAMNVLRELTLATERVVRGTNPDWDPLFEEADIVLGREPGEAARHMRDPFTLPGRVESVKVETHVHVDDPEIMAMKMSEAAMVITPIANTMAEGGVSPHDLYNEWIKKRTAALETDLAEAEAKFLAREAEIEARVKTLLLEESVLHERQETLINLVEDYPADDKFKTVLTKIVTEDRSRPSPDYRMLLVKTYDALAKLHEHLLPVLKFAERADVASASQRAATIHTHLKEAMRLTNIVHLPATGFGAGTVEGVALKHVIDDLRSELEEHLQAFIPGQALDDVWLDETIRHLKRARTEPDKYLAERGVQRYEP